MQSDKVITVEGKNSSFKVLVIAGVIFASFIVLIGCTYLMSSPDTESKENSVVVHAENYEYHNLDIEPDEISQGDVGGVDLHGQDSREPESGKGEQLSFEVNNVDKQESENQELKVLVREGDSLHRIFKRSNISVNEIAAILSEVPESGFLKTIHPGDVFEITLAPTGSLLSLSYSRDAIKFTELYKKDGRWAKRVFAKKIETEQTSVDFRVNDNFYLAARVAGLKDREIYKITEIFQWDIDFSRDISKGDEFKLVLEQDFVDGERIGMRKPVAIKYISGDQERNAYYFETPDGIGGYYDENGDNLRKAFLKAPLEYSYISSSFKPRRFHPILKRYKAHNGTDFRAHKGTPVYAAGDGVVYEASYNRFNGNYVFIKHGTQYITKYLHFSKKAVRKGQRVKQGQVIGYVGSTGMAEAAHLHYEFLVGGKHVNPRTVKIPQANPISDDFLSAFKHTVKGYFDEESVVADKRAQSESYQASNSFAPN